MTTEYMIIKSYLKNDPENILKKIIKDKTVINVLSNIPYKTIKTNKYEFVKENCYNIYIYQYNETLFNEVKKHLKEYIEDGNLYDFIDIIFIQIQNKYIEYINFDLNMLYPVNEKLTKNTLYCIPKVSDDWYIEEIEKCMYERYIISLTFDMNKYYKDLILSAEKISEIKDKLIDNIEDIVNIINVYV